MLLLTAKPQNPPPPTLPHPRGRRNIYFSVALTFKELLESREEAATQDVLLFTESCEYYICSPLGLLD